MAEAGERSERDGAANVAPAPSDSDASASSAKRRDRGPKRRPATAGELAAVGAVAVLAAVLAVVLSSAAPTNTAWIDALERALAVAAISVAASRARRWTLVWASVLVTVTTPWPLSLIGLGALVATWFQVETRQRSRLLGAVIGAVVALLSLQLEVPGPIGMETLLALVATVPVLLSGYRRSTRVVRRRVRMALVVAIVVLASFAVLSAVAAALSLGRVTNAVAFTEDAVDLARNGQGDASSAAFSDANDEFAGADSTIGSWWASGSRVIPVVGANLAAVQRSVGAGVELTGAGASLVSGAEFSDVQLDGGGVDLVALEALTPRVGEATEALSEADELLGGAGSTWLLAPLDERLRTVDDRLAQTRATTVDAAAAVEGLPAMLGADGPRRYLFLFGNPAESRDLGGHIGNWAEVVFDGGQIELVDVGSPLELSSPELNAGIVDRYPASFVEMSPPQFPQNLGATADLPTSARMAAEIYEHKTSRPIDGVAYADVEAFAALLDLVGPVGVPGLPGFELTSANAVQFLTQDQYTMFDTEQASGDALEIVIETVFDRLTSTKLPGPDRLGKLFAPLVDSGRFQLASLRPGDAEMLDHFQLQGGVPSAQGHDVLGVLGRNAGPSKIDSFMEREVFYNVRWDPGSGQVNAVVTVDVTNDAPPGGVNQVIGGNTAGVVPGTNVTDLVVLSPFRLRSVLVDGVARAARPLLEDGMWRHSVRLAVGAGDTTSVNFHMEGTVDPGDTYRLRYVGQPSVRTGDVTATLEPASGRSIEGESVGGSGAPATVVFPQDEDTTVTWVLGSEP